MTQEPGTTALFVVDAFRFEMGEELYRQLAGESATTVHLKARLAELPIGDRSRDERARARVAATASSLRR